MTDYSALTDRELDALVATGPMGWHEDPTGEGWLDADGKRAWSGIETYTPTKYLSTVGYLLDKATADGCSVLLAYNEAYFTRGQRIEAAYFGRVAKDRTVTTCRAATLPRALCEALVVAYGEEKHDG